MKLGKLFVNSIVRELGRNSGKVISNKVFGNAHSTPVRMVSSSSPADTEPLYNARGTRRIYRHNLDRVINGNLPGSRISAKKQLVALRTALEDLFQSGGQADDYFSWLTASENYVENVVKIISHDEVTTMAKEVYTYIDVLKDELVKGIRKVSAPRPPESKSVQITWLLISTLITAVAAVVIYYTPGLSPWLKLDDNARHLPTIVMAMAAFVLGIVTLSANSQAKKQQRNYAYRMYQYEQLHELADLHEDQEPEVTEQKTTASA
jgi:hypothetical protein